MIAMAMPQEVTRRPIRRKNSGAAALHIKALPLPVSRI
jgi:hypothetical protein